MSELLGILLGWIAGASKLVMYLILAGAAALENIVPPIPADAVIVFGGLLAGRGVADTWLVFLVVWISNVAGALAVYYAGRRYGPGFFAGRIGQYILNPGQVERLSVVYRKYGLVVIFVSRFLPMFRAVVPVFAGVSRIGFLRTAIPIAAASAIWYGVLIYLAAVAGRNWNQLMRALSSVGGWFWGAAIIVAAGVLWWWWRSR